MLLLLVVGYLYLFKREAKTYDKKRLTYNKRTSLRHLLGNKLNKEYFIRDKLKDILNT